MNKAHVFWVGLIGAISLLAALAAFSRIATMEKAPQYIKDGATALGNLFNGAFGL